MTIKKGLRGFELKLMALILMLLDHLNYFLPSLGLPIYFRWLGRLVAPIFIYLTVEGYCHSKNLKKYGLRLYLGFLAMGILNYLIPKLMFGQDFGALDNSMFGSLLMLVYYLHISSCLLKNLGYKRYGDSLVDILLLALPLAVNIFLLAIDFKYINQVSIFIPMILSLEGGVFTIIIGLIFYLFRSNRLLQLLIYSSIPALIFYVCASHGLSYENLFIDNYQWMMIFAAIPLYFYNSKEGRKMKRLFYIFYPSHIYILYILGNYLVDKK